ncbi:MAG: serine/threonine-protein kinase [Anaerolineae bacterium]
MGRGGAGQVYRVRDRLRSSEVALKLLRLEGVEALEAFRAEFRTLARVFHPALVQVYDFGRVRVSGGLVAFYTAALVDGVGLSEFARNHSWPEVRRALGDGLRALALLHRTGFVHGDFKPANLLVDRKGRGTLIDLGCSAAALPGTVSGTRGYIAPELLSGQRGDRRADLYAVGATLRELRELTARVPRAVEALTKRLLSTSPSNRPSDVSEVLAALNGETLRWRDA